MWCATDFFRQLFTKCRMQYNQLRKRNAFLDNYRKEPMFADGLEEFDSSKFVGVA